MSDSDLQLLERYTRQHAEDAFAEIVRRHLDLVFSAALRQVRSPELAEEVAQSAFTDLARQAHRLAPDTVLSAWLYQVTRRTAIDVVRREARRQAREHAAQELNTMNAAAPDWTHIEPLLDEAMQALEDTDRSAVLLRYFENKSLREVGQTLGTTEEAARKRVRRAVERLGEILADQGVGVGASGLVILISANAVQAAPVSLGSTISAALAGTAVATTAAATTTKAIAMTALQKALIAATLVAAIGTGLYEARQTSRLRDENQALLQQQKPLNELIQQLQRERGDAASNLRSLRDENERLNRNTAELPRLRNEVARLKGDAGVSKQARNNPFVQKALTWKTKESKLRGLLEQMPEQKIPELSLLDEGTYLGVAQDADLDTDEGIRAALSSLRFRAENNFANKLQSALAQYTKANNGQPPGNVADLAAYIAPPMDNANAMLERYQILDTGTNVAGGWSGGWVVAQKKAVDPDRDFRWMISPVGFGPSAFKASGQ